MGETVITDMVHHKLLKTVWISNRHSYAVGGNLTTNDVFRHLTVFTPAEWKRCCGLEIKSKQSEPHPLKSFTTLNFSFLFFFFFFCPWQWAAVSIQPPSPLLTRVSMGVLGFFRPTTGCERAAWSNAWWKGFGPRPLKMEHSDVVSQNLLCPTTDKAGLTLLPQ